jgi:carboxyl-terminal processing protease
MDLREVVKLIRGTRGTEVRLTLVREEAGKTVQLVVPIIREQIQLKDRAAKSTVVPVTVHDGPGGVARQIKIGVIDLPSFYMDFEGRQNREKGYKSSSTDMRNEINALKKQGVDGMIIDLRSNGGGSLDESIDIAGLFFDKGPVVQIKDTRGATYVQKDENPETLYSGPLVVMINKQSASASEIFAGAIQDYQRGLIVGDAHTFGKGTVQNLNDIDDKLGAVKVTISKFYRPSGSSTQLKGVESDIVLPDLLDEYELGEKHYDYALPWDKIQSSDYKSAGLVTPDMTKSLQVASKTRVSTDKGFEKIFDAIKEYKQSEESRSRVSLKEDTGGKDAKKDGKGAETAAATKNGKGSGKKDGKDKDKKERDPDAEEEGEKLPLTDDVHLQETLKIAADYIQLLGKKPLVKVSLPTVEAIAVAKDPGSKGTQTIKKTP